jgi:hypothetical protein
VVVGLRTSSQEKEKNEKRSDNNSECPYRSDKPIKDQCEDTDVCDYQTNTSPGSLTGEFRPSSTSQTYTPSAWRRAPKEAINLLWAGSRFIVRPEDEPAFILGSTLYGTYIGSKADSS